MCERRGWLKKEEEWVCGRKRLNRRGCLKDKRGRRSEKDKMMKGEKEDDYEDDDKEREKKVTVQDDDGDKGNHHLHRA